MALVRPVVLAARMEGTTRRNCCWVWHCPFYGCQTLNQNVVTWNRAQQCLRIGMRRPVKYRIDIRDFDFLAQIHHDHIVRHFRDDTEVMRDKHDCHLVFGLKVTQQVEDLRLGCHIERSGRLVGDQEPGMQVSAIAIITRWRIPPLNSWRYCFSSRSGVGSPTRLIKSTAMASAARFAHILVQSYGFDHLIANGMHRTERSHWLLKDHGDFAPANLMDFRSVRGRASQYRLSCLHDRDK